uniref:Uncharacterized protein n=1 Tax=Anguilla anguilla TaxID=7936 RepID=A0A0E9V872_ANGAN
MPQTTISKIVTIPDIGP